MSLVAEILERFDKLTVPELVDLKEQIEEKYGVTAAAPMMMAGAMAGGGAAAPAAEEKTEFTVLLKEAGAQKINLIKVVRAATGLGLKEAKDLVDGAPKSVKEGVPKEEAGSTLPGELHAGGSVLDAWLGAALG